MRHRVKRKLFNRDTNARKILFKNLLANLFEHGTIETTEPKAKQIKRLADKLIHRAQAGTVPARRLLERFFGSKKVVNRLVDGVAPAMKDRSSGFTRITRVGRRRGDDAEMVFLELITQPTAKPEVKKVEETKKTDVPAEEKKTTKKSAAKPKQAADKK